MPNSLRYIALHEQSFGQLGPETCRHPAVPNWGSPANGERIMVVNITTEDLMADLRALVAEMEALLEEGGANLKERLGEAGAALESDLAHAKQRLADLQRGARSRVRQTARYVDRYARHNPWQMSGATLAVGLLIGLAIGLAAGARQA
jgi:ElaB/YqjD/DUF883 family membrane-anchored ribosome-binding protein